MNAVVECVPNISEGRNLELIHTIVDAARVDGCSVLSVEPDADYNRTVITLAGDPEAVAEAATLLSVEAIRRIDMREHAGEHPRLGVVDVCPFIPIQGIDMEACAASRPTSHKPWQRRREPRRSSMEPALRILPERNFPV